MLKEKIKKIWTIISQQKKIVIFSHKNPDGDTIGSSLGLRELIKTNLKQIKVKISGDKYPEIFSFLPKANKVSNKFIDSALGIIVDAPTKNRIYDQRVNKIDKIIKIDHHQPFKDKWLEEISGDNFSSTGEIIYLFAKYLKLKVTKIFLKSILVAIWTDTNGLTERNPTKQTFEIVKKIKSQINSEKVLKQLKPSKKSQKVIKKTLAKMIVANNNKVSYIIEEKIIGNNLHRIIIDEFSSISKTEVTLLAIKQKDNSYRVSIRTNKIDAAKIAKAFGGGGHFHSAGANLKTKNKLLKLIEHLTKTI